MMPGNTSLIYFSLSIMFAGSREVCGGQAAIGRVLRAQLPYDKNVKQIHCTNCVT